MLRSYLLIALLLTACGGSSDNGQDPGPRGDYWPIVVPIELKNYVHTSATINGTETDCLFDTGAPRELYLPGEHYVTARVGNYERTLTSSNLWDAAAFADCIIGLRFFEGATEYTLDLEANELLVR